MNTLVLAVAVVLIVILVYYFVLSKRTISRIKFYKPSDLINSQSADESTYQIAQIVLFDSNGTPLTASDVTVTGGTSCYGTNPSIPFDGNTSNQNYPHVYHSCQKDLNNFLQAVLKSPQSLSTIKVYNRKDCCGSRLAGVVLETYDSSDTLLNSYTLTNSPVVVVDLVNNQVA